MRAATAAAAAAVADDDVFDDDAASNSNMQYDPDLRLTFKCAAISDVLISIKCTFRVNNCHIRCLVLV